MPIRRPRIPVFAGVPLLALAACSDLLREDAPRPERVLVQVTDADREKPRRAGHAVQLQMFVSDAGGLGVGGVPVRWETEGGGSVRPDGERTNGNGFALATWTLGTEAGAQAVRVRLEDGTLAGEYESPILPDTVVGTVELQAESDTVTEGETQALAVTRVADQYGNAYNLASTRDDAPPPITITTLDPEVLDVTVSGVTARVTARMPGTGRVVARSGGRADTVTIQVEKFVPPGTFRQVQAGSLYSCGVTLAGAAYCWGDNAGGLVGTGVEETPVPAPVVPAGLAGQDVADLDAGQFHACAVAGGTAWCWGDNSVGQLGDGSAEFRRAPSRVQAPAGVSFTQVGTGLYHTCALDADGAAWCWGDNSAGQAGSGAGPGDPVLAPARVAMPAGVAFARLSVGGVHTCGVTAAGAAWCWGDNSTGQLGIGSFDAVTDVVRAGDAAFARVAAGVLHTCAATAAGAVFCWGDNSSNQLGNGGADPSATPVAVSGGLAAAEVSSGFYGSCAVATDGRAFCWGANATGRLGDGTVEPSAVPVEVLSGAVRFLSVDAGVEHTCALGADNEGYCWGRNSSGELGTGAVGNQNLTPVRVISPLSAVRTGAATRGVRPRPAARPESACRRLPARTRSRIALCG